MWWNLTTSTVIGQTMITATAKLFAQIAMLEKQKIEGIDLAFS